MSAEKHPTQSVLSEIEPSKENILPQREGRSVLALSRGLSERPDARESIKADHEERVGMNPQSLDLWLAYISWMEEAYPSGSSEYGTLLERCARTLQDCDKYKGNARYLKVWIKYAQSLEDPEDLFTFLSGKCIGIRRALLYEAWAMVLENKGHWTDANEVFLKGIAIGAKPLPRLKERHKLFESRMLDRVDQGNFEKPVIHALNAISRHTAGLSHRGRDTQASKQGMALDENLPVHVNSNFTVAAENHAVSKVRQGITGVWKDYGKKLERSKENSQEAGTWNRPLDKHKGSQSSEDSFKVFRDKIQTPSPKRDFRPNPNAPSKKFKGRVATAPAPDPNVIPGYDTSVLEDGTLSFEEVRAMDFGVYTSVLDDSDDMEEESPHMEMTVNYSMILSSLEPSSPGLSSSNCHSSPDLLTSQSTYSPESSPPLPVREHPEFTIYSENTRPEPVKPARRFGTVLNIPEAIPEKSFQTGVNDENRSIQRNPTSPHNQENKQVFFFPEMESKSSTETLHKDYYSESEDDNTVSRPTFNFGSPETRIVASTANEESSESEDDSTALNLFNGSRNQPHNASLETTSDNFSFNTGTVTINTKQALNAVFKMWNKPVDE